MLKILRIIFQSKSCLEYTNLFLLHFSILLCFYVFNSQDFQDPKMWSYRIFCSVHMKHFLGTILNYVIGNFQFFELLDIHRSNSYLQTGAKLMNIEISAQTTVGQLCE